MTDGPDEQGLARDMIEIHGTKRPPWRRATPAPRRWRVSRRGEILDKGARHHPASPGRHDIAGPWQRPPPPPPVAKTARR